MIDVKGGKDEAMPVASEPPKRKAKETSLIPVTILAAQGAACLVQWFEAGVERRCSLPAEAVAGQVALSSDMLATGAAYGIPWAKVLRPAVTAERLEAALHTAGLWTFEDVQQHPDRALGALQSAYGIDLGQLLVAAQEHGAKKEV